MDNDIVFHVYVVDPLDFHSDTTVPLRDFLSKSAWRLASDHSMSGPLPAVLAAGVARTLERHWDLDDDDRMVVGHDLSSDTPVFIFKMHNNGTTILVSMRPLALPGRCIFEEHTFRVSINVDHVGATL